LTTPSPARAGEGGATAPGEGFAKGQSPGRPSVVRHFILPAGGCPVGYWLLAIGYGALARPGAALDPLGLTPAQTRAKGQALSTPHSASNPQAGQAVSFASPPAGRASLLPSHRRFRLDARDGQDTLQPCSVPAKPTAMPRYAAKCAPTPARNRTMRRFVTVIMCIGNFALHAADTNAPVVKVDEKHQMNYYRAGTKAETYHIHASPSIVLDATGYSFDIPLEVREKGLNSVQLVQSKTNQFELRWQPGKTRYELSKATLQPLPGSKPFEGFKAGDKMMVAIGVVYAPRKFAPVWISTVEVE
jgi:hypothetical protein